MKEPSLFDYYAPGLNLGVKEIVAARPGRHDDTTGRKRLVLREQFRSGKETIEVKDLLQAGPFGMLRRTSSAGDVVHIPPGLQSLFHFLFPCNFLDTFVYPPFSILHHD